MKCVICGKEIIKTVYRNSPTCSSKCFEKHYWQEVVKEYSNSSEAVIISNKMYIIRDENVPKYEKGFEGREFNILFKDGRKVRTTNLWSLGEIPNEFIEQLPNNATFDWSFLLNKGENNE